MPSSDSQEPRRPRRVGTAGPRRVPGRAAPKADRKPWPWLLAAGALAAVFVVGALLLGGRTKPNPNPKPAAARPDTKPLLPPEPSPEERLAQLREEYRRKRILAETVEEIYRLAVWCRKNGLREEAKAEAKRVLANNPDHAGARRLLGYRRFQGDHPDYRDRWLTPAEWRVAQKKEKEYQARLAADPKFAAMERAVSMARYELLREVPHIPVREWPYLILLEDFGSKERNEYYAWEKASQVRAFYRYMKATFPKVVYKEPKVPFIIICLKDRASFDRFTGGRNTTIRAFYNTQSRYIYYYEKEGDNKLSGLTAETVLGVLFHECTHQLLAFLRPRNAYSDSVWFEEAFAEYIGSVKKTGRDAEGYGTFKIAKVNNYRLHQIQQFIKAKRYFPLWEMFQLRTYEEADQVGLRLFGVRGIGKALLYSQGWSFIYFCMNEPTGKYRAKMRAYIKRDVVDGEGDEEIMNECFGIKHPEKEWPRIEREWLAFVRKLRPE